MRFLVGLSSDGFEDCDIISDVCVFLVVCGVKTPFQPHSNLLKDQFCDSNHRSVCCISMTVVQGRGLVVFSPGAVNTVQCLVLWVGMSAR